MFTGIIEELGKVKDIKQGAGSAVLNIQASKVLEGSKIGDSIAVNGICLTITELKPGAFAADVMHESLKRSSLSRLQPGSEVNLERAMPADGRFGGHIVSGHVDGVGTIKSVEKDDIAVIFRIIAAPKLLKYIVEKGSIAVDGISLTVVDVESDSFRVSIIPHTLAMTILKDKGPGDIVNLECDIIGKYVEKLLQGALTEEDNNKESKITQEFLSRNGF